MLAKVVAIYSFLRFYKELEAGGGAGARQGRGLGGGAYDMAPMSMREERPPIGSPNGGEEFTSKKK